MFEVPFIKKVYIQVCTHDVILSTRLFEEVHDGSGSSLERSNDWDIGVDRPDRPDVVCTHGAR